jgi:sigma54-dependent transcription regulator
MLATNLHGCHARLYILGANSMQGQWERSLWSLSRRITNMETVDKKSGRITVQTTTSLKKTDEPSLYRCFIGERSPVLHSNRNLNCSKTVRLLKQRYDVMGLNLVLICKHG